MKVGYARVSSSGQKIRRQVDALERLGCDAIHKEKRSGDSRKVVLERVLLSLNPGDELVVDDLDRLSRELFELLAVFKWVEALGAVVVEGSRTLHLTNPDDFPYIACKGVAAQLQLNSIRANAAKARASLKRRGLRSGPKRKLSREQRNTVVELVQLGKSKKELQRMYGVGRSTIYQVVEEALVEDFLAGVTMDVLASKYRVDIQMVSRVIQELKTKET